MKNLAGRRRSSSARSGRRRLPPRASDLIFSAAAALIVVFVALSSSRGGGGGPPSSLVGGRFIAEAFAPPSPLSPSIPRRPNAASTLSAAKKASGGGGFGGGGGGGFGSKSPGRGDKKAAGGGKKGKLARTLNDEPTAKSGEKSHKTGGTTYVKSEQEALLASLASTAAATPVGRAVAESPLYGTPEMDPFWELMPSLLSSKFPRARNEEMERLAGFVRHALDPTLPLEEEIAKDPWRPHDEIHAYMPGLGPREPFVDPSRLELCRMLSDNIDVIEAEYEALLEDMGRPGGRDRFQSVTSMNYESGWRTLVLFYNGHRIPDFPYRLCPVTSRILESVPLAGRIAGFNRQRPQTGIPLHSDGNNMWLTCQMGIKVPSGNKAWIRVGPETRRWQKGECLLYDTTYEHETFNESKDEERVVLHVDFFNTLAMTQLEIEAMRYVYAMREEFMKAEGVAKVGAQIL